MYFIVSFYTGYIHSAVSNTTSNNPMVYQNYIDAEINLDKNCPNPSKTNVDEDACKHCFYNDICSKVGDKPMTYKNLEIVETPNGFRVFLRYCNYKTEKMEELDLIVYRSYVTKKNIEITNWNDIKETWSESRDIESLTAEVDKEFKKYLENNECEERVAELALSKEMQQNLSKIFENHKRIDDFLNKHAEFFDNINISFEDFVCLKQNKVEELAGNLYEIENEIINLAKLGITLKNIKTNFLDTDDLNKLNIDKEKIKCHLLKIGDIIRTMLPKSISFKKAIYGPDYFPHIDFSSLFSTKKKEDKCPLKHNANHSTDKNEHYGNYVNEKCNYATKCSKERGQTGNCLTHCLKHKFDANNELLMECNSASKGKSPTAYVASFFIFLMILRLFHSVLGFN